MTSCYMVLDGDGDYAQTADKAQLDITGDIDIRAAVALDDWTPATIQNIVNKRDGPVNQRSYMFQVMTDGTLRLVTSTDGIDNIIGQSSVAVSATPGESVLIRVTLDVDNGSSGRDFIFHTKPFTPGSVMDDLKSPAGWTQLGTTITQSGTTSIFVTTVPLVIGATNVPSAPMQFTEGKVYGAVVLDGINGTVVADPDFSTQPAGTTPFTDDAGNDWDYEGDAHIFCPPTFDPFSIGVPQSLGCGDWVAQFTERGGSPVLFEAAVSSLSARRINDGYGAAQAVIPVSAIPSHCIGDAAKLRPWEHEINLLRDGTTEWVGPISDRVSLQRVTIEVHARDLSAWWDRRTAPLNRTFGESTDLSTIFRVLAEDGLLRDPSPNISFDVLPSGVQAGRTVRAGEQPYIGDLLRELARDGVDYTMSGRTVRVRGPAGGDEIGPFLTSHFATDLRHDADGLAVGSEFVVIGGSPEGSTVPPVGVAGGVHPRVGLVTRVIQESNITTQLAATSAAQQYLQALGIPPVVVQGTLLQEAPVSFGDLLPGNVARLEVDVGGTHISERMWLVGVEVRVDGRDEKIRVTFGRGEATP